MHASMHTQTHKNVENSTSNFNHMSSETEPNCKVYLKRLQYAVWSPQILFQPPKYLEESLRGSFSHDPHAPWQLLPEDASQERMDQAVVCNHDTRVLTLWCWMTPLLSAQCGAEKQQISPKVYNLLTNRRALRRGCQLAYQFPLQRISKHVGVATYTWVDSHKKCTKVGE